jgi:hypothetical protein
MTDGSGDNINVVAHGVDGEVDKEEHEGDHEGRGAGKDVLEETDDGGVHPTLHRSSDVSHICRSAKLYNSLIPPWSWATRRTRLCMTATHLPCRQGECILPTPGSS